MDGGGGKKAAHLGDAAKQPVKDEAVPEQMQGFFHDEAHIKLEEPSYVLALPAQEEVLRQEVHPQKMLGFQNYDEAIKLEEPLSYVLALPAQQKVIKQEARPHKMLGFQNYDDLIIKLEEPADVSPLYAEEEVVKQEERPHKLFKMLGFQNYDDLAHVSPLYAPEDVFKQEARPHKMPRMQKYDEVKLEGSFDLPPLAAQEEVVNHVVDDPKPEALYGWPFTAQEEVVMEEVEDLELEPKPEPEPTLNELAPKWVVPPTPPSSPSTARAMAPFEMGLFAPAASSRPVVYSTPEHRRGYGGWISESDED